MVDGDEDVVDKFVEMDSVAGGRLHAGYAEWAEDESEIEYKISQDGIFRP